MITRSSSRQVRRNPKDIVLTKEVTLQEIADWLLKIFGPSSEHISSDVRDLDMLKEKLSPIYSELKDGDQVWLCCSQVRGPLTGHEGVALVRNGQPVIYKKIIQY